MGFKRRPLSISITRISALTIILSGMFASSSLGQDFVSGSPEKGALLADRLCSSCHLSVDKAISPVPAGIPTFRGIANKPGQTGMHIVGVLVTPHAPMPNISLSRDEISDIVAYLQALRSDQTMPPLLPMPQEQAPKRKYPEPT